MFRVCKLLSSLIVSFCFVFHASYSAADDASAVQELFLSSDDSSRVLDAVVAAIDGEPITWSGFRRFVSTEGLEIPQDRVLLRQLVQKMVVSNLLVKEAEKAGMSVSDEEVEAYLQRVRSENGVSEKEFEAMLQQRGLTLEQYSAYVRKDILKARVLSKEIRSKINVVDEDIDRYIAERPELRPEEGTLRLYEINIPKDIEDAAAERKKIESALKNELNPAQFRELGGKYYRDLGYVKVDELKDELSERLLKMNDGDVTELIENESSYQVYKVSAPGSSDKLTDETLKSEIREKIFQVRYQEELGRFLDKELPKRYHVDLLI